jgi:predicted nucleic acid-binding protein
VGLILDSSLFIADERNRFNLASWLRARPPEPVAVSAITLSELWFGIESEPDTDRLRRRTRWLEKTIRRLEVVPLDAAMARVHARLWLQLSNAGLMIGPHDLIVAAAAVHRRWTVATFNATEFRHVRGLEVIEPACSGVTS